MNDEMADLARPGLSRRQLLTRVGVGAGVAWAAPVLMSTPVFAAGGSVPGGPTCTDTTERVTAATADWSNDDPGDITPTFVTGPATPPLPPGSAHLLIQNVNQKVLYTHAVLFNMSDVRSSGLGTYRHSSSNNAFMVLYQWQFFMDPSNVGGHGTQFTTLYFDPGANG